MLGNIWVDGMFGTVPVLGDIFDLRYKANMKNVMLVKEYIAEDKHKGSARGMVLLILFIIAVMIILSIILLWKISQWFFTQGSAFLFG
jgi:hypothetical protein